MALRSGWPTDRARTSVAERGVRRDEDGRVEHEENSACCGQWVAGLATGAIVMEKIAAGMWARARREVHTCQPLTAVRGRRRAEWPHIWWSRGEANHAYDLA